jgi:hypothetical protein
LELLVYKECLVWLELQDSRDSKDSLDLRDRWEVPVLPDSPVLRVLSASLGPLDSQEHLVLRALKAIMGQLVSKVLTEIQAPQVQQDPAVLQETLDKMELQVLRERLDFQEHLAHLEVLEMWVLQDSQDQMGHQAPQVHQDHQDHPDRVEHQELMDSQDQVVPLAQLETRDHQALLELLAPRVPMDQLEVLAIQERLVL